MNRVLTESSQTLQQRITLLLVSMTYMCDICVSVCVQERLGMRKLSLSLSPTDRKHHWTRWTQLLLCCIS